MSDVPWEIHREILLRLPATSVFRFRTVCKPWLRIIDDPAFVRSHTTTNHRSSPNLLIRTRGGTFCSFPLHSLNYTTNTTEHPLHVTHVKNLTLLHVPRVTSLPAPSCNGLILAPHFDDNKIWAIWNPLTGDSHQIPPPVGFELRLSCAGIGYDSTTDDYKVVRVDRLYNIRNRTVYQTLIYSLKSNSWKRIKNCPNVSFHKWGQRSVFFNGALHWKVSRTRIVALNMATEEYRSLPLPRMMRLGPAGIRLDSFDGCLVVSDNYAMWQSWVMRGYESEKPFWVELFSAEERSVMGGSSGRVWPLAYSDGERRFIVQHDNRIMRWDIGKGSVKRVTIDGLSADMVTSQVVPGSLFRLSDKEAEVKRTRRKRLRFTTTTIDSGRLSSDSESDY